MPLSMRNSRTSLKRKLRMESDRVQRFWAKVEKTATCWNWRGGCNGNGYGRFCYHGQRCAHRLAYELLVGPIPEGMQLDHLCRNRRCVNPAHLEPVTCRENILRGGSLAAQRARRTHCKRGHPLAGDNMYTWKNHRWCKACMALHLRNWRGRCAARRQAEAS